MTWKAALRMTSTLLFVANDHLLLTSFISNSCKYFCDKMAFLSTVMYFVVPLSNTVKCYFFTAF